MAIVGIFTTSLIFRVFVLLCFDRFFCGRTESPDNRSQLAAFVHDLQDFPFSSSPFSFLHHSLFGGTTALCRVALAIEQFVRVPGDGQLLVGLHYADGDGALVGADDRRRWLRCGRRRCGCP